MAPETIDFFWIKLDTHTNIVYLYGLTWLLMYDSDSDHNNMKAKNPKHSFQSWFFSHGNAIKCFFGMVNTANLFTIPWQQLYIIVHFTRVNNRFTFFTNFIACVCFFTFGTISLNRRVPTLSFCARQWPTTTYKKTFRYFSIINVNHVSVPWQTFRFNLEPSNPRKRRYDRKKNK